MVVVDETTDCVLLALACSDGAVRLVFNSGFLMRGVCYSFFSMLQLLPLNFNFT